MDFEALLGLQLKDDQVMEVLEVRDMQVVYDFDRTHEGMPDRYWAAALEDGFQFRFNEEQKLDVVFLYIEASEGFTPIARDEVGVPLFESFDEAKKGFTQAGISFLESPGKKWWVKGDFGSKIRHYEFRDDALFRVSLGPKEDMTQTVVLKVGDTGSHSELAARRNPDGLVLLYIPGLSALLARAESLKGLPLEASEKKRIADDAAVVATPKSVAEATIRQRGYE